MNLLKAPIFDLIWWPLWKSNVQNEVELYFKKFAGPGWPSYKKQELSTESYMVMCVCMNVINCPYKNMACTNNINSPYFGAEYGLHVFKNLNLVRYIGTQYGADYGNSGDHGFAFGFSYIEKIALGSTLSSIWTIEPRFLDSWQNH